MSNISYVSKVPKDDILLQKQLLFKADHTLYKSQLKYLFQ